MPLALGCLVWALISINAAPHSDQRLERAAVDPNFYIYLCFGQSNMEGNAAPEAADRQYVDPRFQTLACVNFQNPQRSMGQWYTATPPIVRQWTNLGMADYFGRTMVAALPSSVKVGVVDVAVGGIAIEGFLPDKKKVDEYLKTTEVWLQNTAKEYGGYPYYRLVDMAKKAQASGVIKGILLHQGESNNGQQDWLEKVKLIYEALLKDLDLNAADVPLLAGEVVDAENMGVCSAHNTVIAKLPEVIPTAHVIHSNGCSAASDNIHFTASSYRIMGKRYAYEALKAMGCIPQKDANYSMPENMRQLFTLKGLVPIQDVVLRVGGSKQLRLWGVFLDNHGEDLTREAVFTSNDFTVDGGVVQAKEEKEGVVTATYTDFFGRQHTQDIHVRTSYTAPNHVLVVSNGSAGANMWDKQLTCTLQNPMVKDKTYMVKAVVRAERPGDCALWPVWSTSPNRNEWNSSNDIQYLSSQKLTSSYQVITWEFKAQFPHDKLQFAFGQIGGKVYFDEVSCKEKGSDNEMVPNGYFESDDLSNWEVITWAGQSMTVQEDATAGVRPIQYNSKSDGQWYDLQGRPVANPAKGIYIVNGRKFLR